MRRTPRRAAKSSLWWRRQATTTGNAGDVDDLLRQALARVSVKDAVGEVALATGRPRREIYQRALDLAKEDGDGAP